MLRGFALIGVLYVNMHNFGSWEVTGPIHTTAAFFMDGLFQRKFFSLFSLLFGVGFAIQMRRAEERGQSPFPTYWRRLLVLFGLGWAHALIYSGDIVRLYAVLGIVLFPLRKWPLRRLIVVALVLFAAEWTMWIVGTGIPALSETATVVEGVQDSSPSEVANLPSDLTEEQDRVFKDGSFLEVVLANLAWDERPSDLLELLLRMINLYGRGPSALALFILGMAILRSGVLDDVNSHRVAIRRFMIWMLLFGSLQIVSLAYWTIWDPYPSVALVLANVVYPFGHPALALGYAGSSPYSSRSLGGIGYFTLSQRSAGYRCLPMLGNRSCIPPSTTATGLVCTESLVRPTSSHSQLSSSASRSSSVIGGSAGSASVRWSGCGGRRRI